MTVFLYARVSTSKYRPAGKSIKSSISDRKAFLQMLGGGTVLLYTGTD